MKKIAWIIPVLATGALFFGGCFQAEQTAGPEKNELTYGALSGLSWTQLPGTGKEIAASLAGRIWRIDAGSGNQLVRYYDLNAVNPVWTQSVQAGSGTRVEVEDNGNVWVVNTAGDAWKANSLGANWVKYDSTSSGGVTQLYDIGAGGHNGVWAVGGSYDNVYGYQVYQLVNNKWTLSSAARAMRVTVDSSGKPWVINLQSDVFQLTGGAWVKRGTIKAYGIGAGPDGQVWISGPVGSSRIYKWTGSAWDLCDNGLALEIDRGKGFTLVTNASNDIWIGKP